MRKILLASTALVALGVSAASADISISGSGKWTYSSWSTGADAAGASNTTAATAMGITVASSFASDSGLTYGTSHTLTDGAADGSKVYVTGSFGEVRFGGDSAGDAFKTNADVTDGESAVAAGFHGASVTGASGTNGISYFTPSVNGFSAGVSYGDAGAAAGANDDATEVGAKYTQSVGDATVTLKYASTDVSETDAGAADGYSATSMGASVAMGDLAITVSSNGKKADTSGAGDESGTGIGVSYVLSEGLTLKAHTMSSDDNDNASVDNSETAASLTYVIAPGLTGNVAYTDSETAGKTGTATTAYLKVSF